MLAGFGDDEADDDPDSASDPDRADSDDDPGELTFGGRETDPRSKRIALWALGIVVAIIAVVIVSVRFVDTDNSRLRAPAPTQAVTGTARQP